MSTIVDFGSRSIKIYISGGIDQGRQVASINWCPLEAETSERTIEAALDDLHARTRRTSSPVLAVGTAVARRSARLRARIEAFCAGHGWRYETLTQERELALVARAFGSARTGGTSSTRAVAASRSPRPRAITQCSGSGSRI